jgi:hypothetical protein
MAECLPLGLSGQPWPQRVAPPKFRVSCEQTAVGKRLSQPLQHAGHGWLGER